MAWKPSRSWIVVACSVLMVVSAGAVLADEAGTENPASENAYRTVINENSGSPAPSMSGLMVVRDATTGALRAPTAEEYARLSASFDPLNRSDAGLVERHYPDGRVSVVLEGRFQSMTVLRRDVETQEMFPSCTHDAQVAGQVLLDSPENENDPSRGGVR